MKGLPTDDNNYSPVGKPAKLLTSSAPETFSLGKRPLRIITMLLTTNQDLQKGGEESSSLTALHFNASLTLEGGLR